MATPPLTHSTLSDVCGRIPSSRTEPLTEEAFIRSALDALTESLPLTDSATRRPATTVRSSLAAPLTVEASSEDARAPTTLTPPLTEVIPSGPSTFRSKDLMEPLVVEMLSSPALTSAALTLPLFEERLMVPASRNAAWMKPLFVSSDTPSRASPYAPISTDPLFAETATVSVNAVGTSMENRRLYDCIGSNLRGASPSSTCTTGPSRKILAR